jgi:hypothetical protein
VVNRYACAATRAASGVSGMMFLVRRPVGNPKSKM